MKSRFAPFNIPGVVVRYLLKPVKLEDSITVTLWRDVTMKFMNMAFLVSLEYSESPFFLFFFWFVSCWQIRVRARECACVFACASVPHSYASASYQRPLCLIEPRSRFPFISEMQRRATLLPSDKTSALRLALPLFKTSRNAQELQAY